MQEHRFINRLGREKSPYLLQHSHNPVDWYPWGNEAFNAAKEGDKPILLSIGYATCHWCHVMERESFEDPQLAKLMNETFINIKVDREELPEVDSLYMEFAQSMMAGSAGWPLNVVLTPELQPFFAATYLPPHSRHGLMGLTELILRIKEVWTGEERERVLQQAFKIVEVFEERIHTRGDEIPDKQIIEDTAEMLFKMADPIYGGIKGAPKFPIGYQMNFMLGYSSKQKDSRALFLVERTLDMMHRGGIYDHLGGGFSRYSVDEQWLVPHFEKMLYDNAILAHSYFEAWQVTKRPLFKQVCEEIFQYILRDMTHSEGGFYSAQDADSEGSEGFFYTWTYSEVLKILGENEGKIFCEFYGITELGNFEGRNVLHTAEGIDTFASKKMLTPQQLEKSLNAQKQLLWKVREGKEHPFKDDKILSSWNGLMIFAFIEAACAWNNASYLQAALNAATFIKTKMWEKGVLLRRWRGGEALHAAGIDEYAFLIKALISLFEADCGTEWLEWAIELCSILSNEFKSDGGAFYQTNGKEDNIILRKCQFSDGAEPSGNAIHCENLLRLYQLTLQGHYLEEAEDILKAVRKYLDNYSPGYCYHLINLQHFYDRNAPNLVIALNGKEQHKNELLNAIYQSFIANKSVVWRHPNDDKLIQHIPFVKEQQSIDGKTTVYICKQGICQKPLTELEEILEAIQKL